MKYNIYSVITNEPLDYYYIVDQNGDVSHWDDSAGWRVDEDQTQYRVKWILDSNR